MGKLLFWILLILAALTVARIAGRMAANRQAAPRGDRRGSGLPRSQGRRLLPLLGPQVFELRQFLVEARVHPLLLGVLVGDEALLRGDVLLVLVELPFQHGRHARAVLPVELGFGEQLPALLASAKLDLTADEVEALDKASAA